MGTADESESAVADVLERGELTVLGRLIDASNATLLCRATLGDVTVECVYKPRAGERPLWDFPNGTLGFREVAAHAVARATGWDLVPTTVWRADGPHGPGMCQLWIDVADDAVAVDVVPGGEVPAGFLHVFDAEDQHGRAVSVVHRDHPALRRMAALDVVTNNADRKGGHILTDPLGVIRGVDHGICFNLDDKLRTVLWGFTGQDLGDDVVAGLSRLRDWFEREGGDSLGFLLTTSEVERTRERLESLLTAGVFPSPGAGWPALPWPPI